MRNFTEDDFSINVSGHICLDKQRLSTQETMEVILNLVEREQWARARCDGIIDDAKRSMGYCEIDY